MLSIPAPARFTDLRQFLHEAGIDAAYLSFKLEQYLSVPDNMPQQDWHSDPHDDHQAWQFRQQIEEFRQLIVARPDDGNGDTAEPNES